MKLFIDADIITYQAAFAGQKNFDWEEGVSSQIVDHQVMRDAVAEIFATINAKFPNSERVLCFSSGDNFRKEILPTYKSNRKDKAPPQLLGDAVSLVESFGDSLAVPRLEADDLMGIGATSPEFRRSAVIVTIDKDLDQIPGLHYNWRKDALYSITEDFGDFWFHRQTLTGDAVDGYAGCPGVGPKTAEKLLLNVPAADRWAIVVGQYIKKGLTIADALQQARVARILRHSEYDTDRGLPIVWHSSDW